MAAYNSAEYNRSYYERNRERLRQAARERASERRAQKPAECRAAVARWFSEPKNRARRREYFRGYAHSDPYRAAQQKRRAAKIQRTPCWLTHEDRKAIAACYAMARKITHETGVRHQVDHELPLLGTTVSGLHVPENLRVVPAAGNQRKGNRLEVQRGGL